MENQISAPLAVLVLGVFIFLIAWIIRLYLKRADKKAITELKVGEDDCVIVEKDYVRVYQGDTPINLIIQEESVEPIQIFPGTKRKVIEIK